MNKKLRIGIVIGPNEWQTVAKLGFDYVEPSLTQITNMSDEEFTKAKRILEKSGIKAETFNCFFPATVGFYTESDGFFREYASRAFGRAKQLGAEILVLGSGGARKIPENMNRDAAENRFMEILRVLGDEAQKWGIKIVIEPLQRMETNMINLVSESKALCERVNHPAIGTLADFYHMFRNGEELGSVAEAKKYLWHTHLARPKDDRFAPKYEDSASILPFADALKNIGYRGRVTLECTLGNDHEKEMTEALDVMGCFTEE